MHVACQTGWLCIVCFRQDGGVVCFRQDGDVGCVSDRMVM